MNRIQSVIEKIFKNKCRQNFFCPISSALLFYLDFEMKTNKRKSHKKRVFFCLIFRPGICRTRTPLQTFKTQMMVVATHRRIFLNSAHFVLKLTLLNDSVFCVQGRQSPDSGLFLNVISFGEECVLL